MTSNRPPVHRGSLRQRYDYRRSDRIADQCGAALRWGLRLIAVAGILGILAGVCQGCGASALQQHATAAKVTRGALDVTATGIEAACDPAAVERRDDAPQRARACLRAAESHDAARAAWLTYVSALVLAADEDGVDLLSLIPLARSLVAAYREVTETLGAFGVDAPPLPGLLEAL